MSLALYIDEHVPAGITSWLRRRGVDVLTVQEDGMEGAKDAVLLDRATELGRIMVTQDADFLREAARRQSSGEPFSGLIYAHQLALSVGQCLAELELFGLAGTADDLANRVVHLPLK
jgi:uncharacterized protein with PIN domain